MSSRPPSTIPSVYDHLDERERAGVVAALPGERSELRAEVERLAAALLEDVRIESVAVEVRSALADLDLADLGVLTGLYRCRDPRDGTVLAYAGTDTPEELAAWVLDEAAKAQVELNRVDVASACPDWERLA